MLRQAGVASSENSRNGSSVAICPFGDCGGCCFGSICWSFSCSGRVAGVDVDVLCREIARQSTSTSTPATRPEQEKLQQMDPKQHPPQSPKGQIATLEPFRLFSLEATPACRSMRQ